MSFEVSFDHNGNIVSLRFIGTVNYDTLIAIMTDLFQHPEFKKGYDGICDTRDALLELSYDDFIKFRAWLETQDKEGQTHGRLAIVADTNLNFATSRMWEGLSVGYYKGLQVFKNEEDACNWLQTSA
ncbi:MAG: hypothetical protein KKC76_11970 [Proteobacteria bacterium]|nr:hypothetical protein [Pseudomonadota bacterium]MBU4295983.1 hypothetical protein [Pseudomonadota bacterium]MCG2747985.1 hypothetical protein [Desulfobulbaceae bacterium]